MTARLTWSQEEDDYLRKLVTLQEKINWNKVKSFFNFQFPEKEKSAKQCRERYINYSSFTTPNGSNLQWSLEDLNVLYREFEKYGARWTKIAQFLPQKSQNSIKNKFYGSLRKAIRKMNTIGKLSKKKIKKNIRYESVARILEAAESFFTLEQKLKAQSTLLRQKILKIMRLEQIDSVQYEVYDLINSINKFNLATRSYRGKKHRKLSSMVEDDQKNRESQQTKQTIKQEQDGLQNPKVYQSPKQGVNFSFNNPDIDKINQQEIKKQNIQEGIVQFSVFPAIIPEFSPKSYLEPNYQKNLQKEECEQDFFELFPERESPLQGQYLF